MYFGDVSVFYEAVESVGDVLPAVVAFIRDIRRCAASFSEHTENRAVGWVEFDGGHLLVVLDTATKTASIRAVSNTLY